MVLLIHVDGSTWDRRRLAAAAVVVSKGPHEGDSASFAQDGFFVGSASAELVGVALGLLLAKELAEAGEPVVIRLDSDRVFNYIAMKRDTKTKSGRKLDPLIAAVRSLVDPEVVGFLFEKREGNQADGYAKKALRSGQVELLLPADLRLALAAVEASSQLVHGL